MCSGNWLPAVGWFQDQPTTAHVLQLGVAIHWGSDAEPGQWSGSGPNLHCTQLKAMRSGRTDTRGGVAQSLARGWAPARGWVLGLVGGQTMWPTSVPAPSAETPFKINEKDLVIDQTLWPTATMKAIGREQLVLAA